jgi:serine carboxypeptidase 1
MRTCVVAAALLAVACHAASFPAKKYGYVNINATYDSNMFYAIRGQASATEATRAERPLVMWLQGGPSASSLFGMLLENGPEKVVKQTAAPGYALVDRVHSWANYANMLYVDNPVGTGFSYTKDPKGFATSDDAVAADLVTFMQGFLVKNPEYVGKDFWVFCESYGGKMTAYFGAALAKAVKAKQVNINFKGVALGDGWVAPVQCMKSYGPYLHAASQITASQSENITRYAQFSQDALERGDGEAATNYWGAQQNYISAYSAGVNWYNIKYYYDYTAESEMDNYIMTAFTKSLGSLIPAGVTFGGQASKVWDAMTGTFMNDGVHQVQEMLDAGVQVNVYSGQVDLIVDTLCIQGWMARLPWALLDSFNSALRLPFYEGSKNVAGFVQKYKNLALWQIMEAGHMVPLDQPAAAETMFVTIIGGNSSSVPPQHASDVGVYPSGPKKMLRQRRGV